jgi:ABC-2 type transport system ATP-binding protein
MAEAILEVADLCKRYGETTALAEVSFSVKQGEIFGLLGPNGAGKTTLLSIVSGLTAATSGSVRIGGANALAMSKELRRSIGFVPQELAVYADLTARENLAFFGRLYGIHGRDLQKRIDEILAAIGLSDRADDPVHVFSGGMKRRLNFGVALVHAPAVVLLDEPTTGVDPQSRNHLFEEVRRTNRAGTTVIYTSHYMEEVQSLCTRIGILDHGKLIACDTLPNLLRQMNGVIRIHPVEASPALRQRLGQLADAQIVRENGDSIELESQAVKDTLLRVIAILNDMQVGLRGLEIEEPSLERVFLHLTGRALRD